MKNPIKIGFCAFAVLFFLQSFTVFAQNKSNEPIPKMPRILSQREQMDVREVWLKKRLDTMVLSMMRKHNVSMWIVVNHDAESVEQTMNQY